MPDSSRLDDTGRIDAAIADLIRLAGSARLHDKYVAASGLSGDLSPALHRILDLLGDGGGASVSDVARILDLSVPTASRRLAQLEREGCAERNSDPTDGRRAVYAITRRGRSTQARYREGIRDEVRTSLAHWSAPERHQLAALLERMVTDFRTGGISAGLDQERTAS